jgi:hypothetical protein
MSARLLLALIPVAAIAALGVAVAVWAGTSSSSASCDDAVLTDAARHTIARAESAGATEGNVAMPEGCDDGDLEMALLEVTRSWHAMPGGVVMREDTHPQ